MALFSDTGDGCEDCVLFRNILCGILLDIKFMARNDIPRSGKNSNMARRHCVIPNVLTLLCTMSRYLMLLICLLMISAFNRSEAQGLRFHGNEMVIADRSALTIPSPDDSVDPEEDSRVKTVAELWDIYCNSVGRNSVLLLNLPPDRRGQLHSIDSTTVVNLRKGLDATFERNLLKGAKVSATNLRGKKFDPRYLIDDNPSTYYAGRDGAVASDITFTLPKAATFDCLMLQEVISLGHRTTRWCVEYYYFGGSFGDTPNDRDFCCNGIVTPDRAVTPKLLEVKNVYQYIRFRMNDANSVSLQNDYTVHNLTDFNLRYVIECNGEPIRTETFGLPDCKPGENRTILIPMERYITDPAAEYFINLEVLTKNDCLWADAGHVVAAAQLPVAGKFSPAGAPVQKTALNAVESDKCVTFSGDGWKIDFSKATGTPVSIVYRGLEMVGEGEAFAFYGYRSISNEPREWAPHTHTLKGFSWEMSHDSASASLITERVSVVGGNTVSQQLRYTVYADGTIDVKADFHTPSEFTLPRLGLQTMFHKSLDNVEWFGKGPMENYPDRNSSAFVGKYRTTAAAMEEKYVRSQSMGCRTATRWLSLTDSAGKGLKIMALDVPFDFTALHFTDRDLWDVKYGHDLEKVRRDEVVLNLDCATRGLGSASCGPGPRPEFILASDSTYSYSFRIKPL